jgi:hypothetical protein
VRTAPPRPTDCKVLLIAKGAPESVLAVGKGYASGGRWLPLDGGSRETVEAGKRRFLRARRR